MPIERSKPGNRFAAAGGDGRTAGRRLTVNRALTGGG